MEVAAAAASAGPSKKRNYADFEESKVHAEVEHAMETGIFPLKFESTRDDVQEEEEEEPYNTSDEEEDDEAMDECSSGDSYLTDDNGEEDKNEAATGAPPAIETARTFTGVWG